MKAVLLHNLVNHAHFFNFLIIKHNLYNRFLIVFRQSVEHQTLAKILYPFNLLVPLINQKLFNNFLLRLNYFQLIVINFNILLRRI